LSVASMRGRAGAGKVAWAGVRGQHRPGGSRTRWGPFPFRRPGGTLSNARARRGGLAAVLRGDEGSVKGPAGFGPGAGGNAVGPGFASRAALAAVPSQVRPALIRLLW